MMLIWRISLKETHCWKDNSEDWDNSNKSYVMNIVFLYNYHCWSKLNRYRGLWGIIAKSSQRKDFVVILKESFHSAMCLFLGNRFYIFFPYYRHAHTFFSTSFRYNISFLVCQVMPIFQFHVKHPDLMATLLCTS